MKQDSIDSAPRKDRPVHPNGRHVVGIDIAHKLHAAAGITHAGVEFGRSIFFGNNRAGVDHLDQALLKPLGGPGQVLIGMEATGHYWMPLYFELKRRGYESIVINPIQTRGKFRSRIRKTKTDKLDARTIARLVLSGEAKAARIPSQDTFELRLLTRHRLRLVYINGDLKRFAQTLMDRIFPEYIHLFSSPLSPTTRTLIGEMGLAPDVLAAQPDELSSLVTRASRNQISKESIRKLLNEAKGSIGIRVGEKVIVEQLRSVLLLLESIDTQIEAMDEELQLRVDKLNSPLTSLRVGVHVIAAIHAESDPISDFAHPWQYAAYVGLDPSTCDSGNMKGSHAHISKRGSSTLRHALYTAASSLSRSNKFFKRHYQRLRAAGRHHNDALVIVTHKLARIVWRMLTDNRPFRVVAPKPSLVTTK
jgi:transposase